MSRSPKSETCAVLVMTDFRHGASVQSALGERWRLQRVNRTEEALWRLRSGRFAALILSLRPPHESNQETLEDVLRAYPETPVVVLVEPGAEAQAARALSRGASGYVVVGPALPVLLEAVLESALHSTHLRKMQSRALELEHRDQVSGLALAVRHEINNPLTGILGSAEMALKSPDLPSALRRRLLNIVKLTEEIRKILQELETIPEKPSRLWQPVL